MSDLHKRLDEVERDGDHAYGIDFDDLARDAKAEIKRLGDLCNLYAEFIAERGLWGEWGKWNTRDNEQTTKEDEK